MSILEVSAASINGSAPIVIFICLIIGALAFIAFIFQESIQKFNKKHNLVNKDNDAVVPVSWNKGRDGVDAEGVPYYGLSGGRKNDIRSNRGRDNSSLCRWKSR